MQAGFQAVHAHSNESAPVKRGNTVLRRLLCVYLPLPGELNLKIVPPMPDPNKTTRERFRIHAEDAMCYACHKAIDGFGNAFESFDGMGVWRKQENGKDVDTKTEVAGGDVSGTIKDGLELVDKLAASEDVKKCFARNVFRFAAAQSGTGYEDMFLANVWEKMPAGKKVDLKEMMVAFAASDMFVTRRVP
jgi:hypothetical protein